MLCVNRCNSFESAGVVKSDSLLDIDPPIGTTTVRRPGSLHSWYDDERRVFDASFDVVALKSAECCERRG